MRTQLLALAATLTAALALVTPAAASVGEGPRLAYVEWVAKPPMTRLVSKVVDGPGRRLLPLAGVLPAPFGGPTWTADGSALVFAGLRVGEGGEIRDNGRTWLFAVSAEGGAARRLAGTAGAEGPVLSPDGATVAFERVRISNRYDPRHPLRSGVSVASTAWTVPLEGGSPRQLSPWRKNLRSAPAAYSPDGGTLLIERDRGPDHDPEVLARSQAGGALRVLARNADQPAFSPDGSRIALVSYRDGYTARGPEGPEPVGELYVVNADGSQPRRLTRTPTQSESQPSWSPSGERLAFLRVRGAGGSGFGNLLLQANADGSCARRVAGSAGRAAPALYGPIWQPGIGRDGYRLGC